MSNPSGAPRITLLMIVKNEAKQIKRCLLSALPLISDWIIIDTGSTDSTVHIIESTLAEIPGTLVTRPWVNFGHNRSELMQMFQEQFNESPKNRYALLLDADCEIRKVDDQSLAKIPEADMFLVRVTGGVSEYRMPYFVRASKNYRYIGATHEYLTCDGDSSRINFDGFEIHHYADGGSRANKFERDRDLLLQEISEQPENSRSHFYLAQTLKDLGDSKRAREHYLKAFEFSSWREEKYLSVLRAGIESENLQLYNDAIYFFHQAIQTSPKRAEGYYHLGKLLNQLRLFVGAETVLRDSLRLSPSDDILFVDRWIEAWGLRMEYGVSLWWNNCKTEAADVFRSLVSDQAIPQHIRNQAQKNLEIC